MRAPFAPPVISFSLPRYIRIYIITFHGFQSTRSLASSSEDYKSMQSTDERASQILRLDEC